MLQEIFWKGQDTVKSFSWDESLDLGKISLYFPVVEQSYELVYILGGFH